MEECMDNIVNITARSSQKGGATTREDEAIDETSLSEHFSGMESSTAKLVLLYLAIEAESSPLELKQTLGLDLLTIFPTLATLEAQQLIEYDGDVYQFCEYSRR